MFSIIISEKGGAERRETFDKNEINVGRVQGNDLMLPKGNVSKHHARLLFRDGRFIVTDLKSTNGTYVNGRKIAQATIVREGDKIYIGDFVLRLDAGSGAEQAPSPDDESVRTLARNNPGASQQQPAQPPAAAPAPMAAAPPQPQPPPQARYGGQGMQGAAAAFAEREAEDEIPPAPPPKPAAAPRPAGAPANNAAAARGQTLQLSNNSRAAAGAPNPGNVIPRTQSAAVAPPAAAPAPAPQAPPPPVAATSPAAQVPPNLAPVVVLPVAPPRVVPRETAQQAGRKLALITLVDRIDDAIDLSPLKSSAVADDALTQSVERAAREQAQAMRAEDEVPEGLDVDQLVTDAVRELVGLGAIGALLEDDDVTEIQCVRNDQVLAVRGATIQLADASFTSDEALGRVISRLTHQSGEPRKDGETVIERRLPRGAHLLAIAPPAAASHALVIRKRRRVDATLEDMVRGGSLSRPMAVFLDACVQARANVVATASSGTSTSILVAALASAAPAGERIALLSDVEEIAIAQALVFSISIADRRPSACEEVVRAAARMHPDRLIASSLPTGAAPALLEAIAEGAEGVIAAASSPSLRQLLARMTSQLVMSRPGLDVDTARECIADAFDVAIELTTLSDGRPRIVRIAEVGTGEGRAPRDLFTFVAEPSGEGSFQGTGNLPLRLQADFAARGVKLDTGLFKRGR